MSDCLLNSVCSFCGKIETITLYESEQKGQLIWGATYNCPHCLNIQEMDGFGIPPDYIRDYLIEKFGLWQVILKPHYSKKEVVSTLMKELNLDFKLCLDSIKNIPIFVGTEFEATWLSKKLGSNNAKVEAICNVNYKKYSFIFSKN